MCMYWVSLVPLLLIHPQTDLRHASLTHCISFHYCTAMHTEHSTPTCTLSKHAHFLSICLIINLHHPNGCAVTPSSIWSTSCLWHRAHIVRTSFSLFTLFYRQVLYLISTTRLHNTVISRESVDGILIAQQCTTMLWSGLPVQLCPFPNTTLQHILASSALLVWRSCYTAW